MPAPRARTRVTVLSLAVLIVIIVVLFLPPVYLISIDSSDYGEHARFAKAIWDSKAILVPHFLYHLLLILVRVFARSLSWVEAGIVVTLAFHALLGSILWAMLYRALEGRKSAIHVLGAIGLTVALMLVTPVTIPTWHSGNLILGYISINIYHNPTIVLLKPFALLAFVSTARIFAPAQARAAPASVLVLATLMLLATLAKPSFAISLLPALAVYAGLTWAAGRPVDWGLLTVGVLVPTLLLLGWQYFGAAASFAQLTKDSALGGGFTVAPFYVMSAHALRDGTGVGVEWRFLLSVLFPLSVSLLYVRDAVRDTRLTLAWTLFAFGALYSYTLAERGASALSGNFLWSGQIALFILFVISALFFLRRFELRQVISHGMNVEAGRALLCVGAFLLHVASGVALYFDTLEP